MATGFFCSTIVFSLALQSFLAADSTYVEEDLFEEVIVGDNDIAEEEKIDEHGSDRQAAFPVKAFSSSPDQKDSSKLPEKKTAPKKLKPHYAGARRAPEKTKADGNEKKKTSRVKNKWYTSKTHPKIGKKDGIDVEIISSELPSDRPHYIRTSNSETSPFLVQPEEANDIQPKRTLSPERKEPEQDDFLQGGFQAPTGHIYSTAEWLYWRTRQEGMEFVTTKEVDFDFQSGFRVGLGVHLPYGFWDIYVNYTRFNPDASESAHGSFYPLFLFQGTGGPSGSRVSEASAHWKIEFQNIDVEVGGAFYIAKTHNFRAFFGLKGAWIDQDVNVRYEGGFIPAGQTFRTHFENDFKGAGPLIGIESNWLVGAGFRFFGNFASALVVGHFDNEQKQYQLNENEVVNLNSDFSLVSPTVQIVGGLAWGKNFNKERWYFGLSAGFEAQYWWRQNQMEQFTDDEFPIYVREKGDLAFYGLTLRGRCDF